MTKKKGSFALEELEELEGLLVQLVKSLIEREAALLCAIYRDDLDIPLRTGGRG